MVASFYRRALARSAAVIAAPLLLALSACSPAASSDAGSVRFAVSTSAADVGIVPIVRVVDVRVLSNHVNLQQPILMGADGDDVTVTFAHRQQQGETFTIVPTSLEARATAPYAYPARARGAAPPFLAAEPSSVALDDGGSLSCWTDEASSRVLVQAFDARGGWRGSPVAVSPDGMAVFGAPHVATSDGRHIVVAFFVSDDERFELVAASLERTR
jgi:hypothetical protein